MLVELLLIFLAVVLVGAAAGEVLAVVKHLRATERMEDAWVDRVHAEAKARAAA